MSRLESIFSNPPRSYRPVPLWSWNGRLTKERITEQLEQFAAQGCGGLFTHARPGFVNGYLTDEWFDLWTHALAEAKRVGIEFHIYDEFMCPGGTAGGNTVAEDPTVAQRELRLVEAESVGKQDVLAFARIESDRAVSATQEEATHAIVLTGRDKGPGGLPAPDLLQRPATDAFIRTTHEKYRRVAAYAFGTDVRFMFCDEPHILASGEHLPCSHDMLREFYLDHGYRLETRLVELCLTTDTSTSVRFDFWKTTNRLFNENFMKPLHDWCEQNRLLFTGHLMENSWPSPRLNPDNMSALRWMQAPGEDLLGFQFSTEGLDKNKLYLLNLKELSSVQNQLGREWSMVETCGGGGYNESYPYFKSCEDFTMSFGVNLIDPHLSHATLAGIGKYDWPQTLSDHSPWWRVYRHHADHVARTNAALSQGRERNRVLLLMPTTTAWCYYTGSGFDSVSGNGAKDKLAFIKNSQLELAYDLYRGKMDFDLGDEFLLEEFGSVVNGKLAVGECAYDAVILPPAMENVMSSTLTLLQRFAEQDGMLLSLRDAPVLVDGRKTDTAALGTRYNTSREAIDALRSHLAPYATAPSGTPLPEELVMRRVVTDEGELWFFTNPWPHAIDTPVMLRGSSALSFDTSTGKVEPTVFERRGDHVVVPLSLPPRGHALVLVNDSKQGPAPARTAETTEIPATPAGVERLKPNLLFIDYCDLEAYGERHEDISTANADGILWRLQGFDGNPWGKQFRRTILDRPPRPDSAFTVTYRFEASDNLTAENTASLRLAVERPWLYTISVNGTIIDQQSGERWFDPDMRAMPIGSLVEPGVNMVTVTADQFQTLCGVMPVYVIGDFALEPVERGFRIENPRPLAHGDWTRQGMPFYADVVRYSYAVDLAQPADILTVRLGEWQGPVAGVAIDEREVGPVMHPPYETRVSGPFAAGTHHIAIDVYGNVKNMMGSHFNDGHPLIWTFQYVPQPMPGGREYRCTPSGNFGVPKVFV